jgi:hypothetical protein
MAHKVRFSIPERELGKADIEFAVHRDNARFGTLKISKGSIVWVRAGAQYGHKLYWGEFDELVREKGRHERRAS